jgi:hypothetical protein
MPRYARDKCPGLQVPVAGAGREKPGKLNTAAIRFGHWKGDPADRFAAALSFPGFSLPAPK